MKLSIFIFLTLPVNDLSEFLGRFSVTFVNSLVQHNLIKADLFL